MARTDPQFNLRIPESLRDLVMAAAKENKRSATAEILARLERSFIETDELGSSDVDRLASNQLNKASLPTSSHLPDGVIQIQVQLDSSGYPISWHEIHEHLSAINRTGKFAPVDQKITIQTPHLVSSSERQDEADMLADFYRKERRKLSPSK